MDNRVRRNRISVRDFAQTGQEVHAYYSSLRTPQPIMVQWELSDRVYGVVVCLSVRVVGQVLSRVCTYMYCKRLLGTWH